MVSTKSLSPSNPTNPLVTGIFYLLKAIEAAVTIHINCTVQKDSISTRINLLLHMISLRKLNHFRVSIPKGLQNTN